MILERGIDGFRFSVLPRPSYLAFLVVFPAWQALLFGLLLALPVSLRGQALCPLMLACVAGWVPVMFWAQGKHTERRRLGFSLGPAGLEVNGTRYGWEALEGALPEADGLVLGDGSCWTWQRMSERQLAQIRSCWMELLERRASRAEGEVPASLTSLRRVVRHPRSGA